MINLYIYKRRKVCLLKGGGSLHPLTVNLFFLFGLKTLGWLTALVAWIFLSVLTHHTTLAALLVECRGLGCAAVASTDRSSTQKKQQQQQLLFTRYCFRIYSDCNNHWCSRLQQLS